jgi:hypothetical protein
MHDWNRHARVVLYRIPGIAFSVRALIGSCMGRTPFAISDSVEDEMVSSS